MDMLIEGELRVYGGCAAPCAIERSPSSISIKFRGRNRIYSAGTALAIYIF